MGKRGLYFAGWCFAGALATISYSATWYVDDATDPSENGSSLHPFDAIQEGLDVATNGDTVLVRNGTYRGAGNKNLDFFGKSIVLQSQFGFFNTHIDCEGEGHAFYIHSGETTATVVRGFAISGAITAIACVSNSGFSVENCLLYDNRTFTNSVTTTITTPNSEQIFHDHSPDGSGGAISCDSCDVVIRNTMISSNVSGSHGGGIYMTSDSSARLENVILSGNVAGDTWTQMVTTITTSVSEEIISTYEAIGAGGGIYAKDSYLEMSNCLVMGNSAGFSGGGIYVSSNAPLVLTDCAIVENRVLSSETGSVGGGVAIFAGDASVFRTILENNLVVQQHSFLRVTINTPVSVEEITHIVYRGEGGGLFAENAGLVVLDGCIVRSNSAGVQGGGIAIRYAEDVAISNCSFVGNKVLDNITPSRGGGIMIDRSHFQITESFLSGQTCGMDNQHYIVTLDVPAFYHTSKDFNGAGDGAGFAISTATGIVLNSEFFENYSHGRGGAIFATSNSLLAVDQVTMISNGAIARRNSLYTRSIVEDQSVTEARVERKGLGKGGAVYAEDTAMSFAQCLFLSNESGEGGGLHLFNASADLENVALIQNSVGYESSWETFSNVIDGTTQTIQSNVVFTGQGGAIFQGGASQQLVNLTLWNNHGETNWDGVYVVTNSALSLLNTIVWSNVLFAEDTTSVSVSYSSIAGGWVGVGNQDFHPKLTPSGRLRATSPCIDAGTAAGAPAVDWENEGRADHPDHPNLFSIVDIGADEFVDTDGDDIADAWEYGAFGNLGSSDETTDGDSDQLTDLGEYNYSTDHEDADTDDDTIPDGWETSYNLNPLFDDASSDPDDDGYSSVDEYITDTDPLQSASYLRLVSIDDSTQSTAVAVGWLTSSQRWYHVQSTKNPLFPWLEVTNIPGSGSLLVLNVSASATSQTFRVKARLP